VQLEHAPAVRSVLDGGHAGRLVEGGAAAIVHDQRRLGRILRQAEEA